MDSDSILAAYLQDRKALIDDALDSLLPAEEPEGDGPQVIFKAARYSIFAGGKRIRPILCLAAAEALGGHPEIVLPVACALECIHTYSLIHDDLPAMDNDDYRRGRLTNHKVFGEDMAILAGDALLTQAFFILSDAALIPGIDTGRLLSVIRDIARAAGIHGMIAGQVLDVQSEGKAVGME
ncbi:MAG: polyprenyl synthetase family protein, partial [Syntrophales bacterium]|nr:polyprenyl synthetase family protein [Syntrophales bacterium]